MTELPVENKQTICEIIWNATIKFFKSLFSSNKKFVIKSHCKDTCCCRNCGFIVAYDEKEEDDSSDDIIIEEETEVVKLS